MTVHCLGNSPAARQKGLALVAVLWMVAALALLAAALAGGTRAEVSMLHAWQSDTRAEALGDGAIHLAAALLHATEDRPDRLIRERVVVDGVEVGLRVVPASGFIDLNLAPETLLRDLLHHGGGLDAGQAEVVAGAILAWRSRDGEVLEEADLITGGRRTRFEVIEDLLQVPGVDFDLFDRMRDLVTTASGVSGVSVMAAPPDVLVVLSEGEANVAATIAARRDAEDPAMDLTRLNQQHLSSAQAGTYRIDAIVPSPDGSARVRSAWLSLSPDRRGAPWTVFDRMPARAQSGVGGL
jgi:general secretion pathway protein K